MQLGLFVIVRTCSQAFALLNKHELLLYKHCMDRLRGEKGWVY